MSILVTSDNFVYLDVTPQMRVGIKRREEIWLAFELYALHDDNSEYLLRTHDEIDKALRDGLSIVIEGGYLP